MAGSLTEISGGGMFPWVHSGNCRSGLEKRKRMWWLVFGSDNLAQDPWDTKIKTTSGVRIPYVKRHRNNQQHGPLVQASSVDLSTFFRHHQSISASFSAEPSNIQNLAKFGKYLTVDISCWPWYLKDGGLVRNMSLFCYLLVVSLGKLLTSLRLSFLIFQLGV